MNTAQALPDTPYQQVYALSSPILKNYRGDLEQLDAMMLENVSSTFIHATRESGTDLIILDNLKTVIQFEAAVTFTFHGKRNQLYLIGTPESVRKSTYEECIELVNNRLTFIADQICYEQLSDEEKLDPYFIDLLEKRDRPKIFQELREIMREVTREVKRGL